MTGRTHQAQPEAYAKRHKNLYLKETIEHLIFEDNQVYTTLVLPILRTDEHHFKWSKIIFDTVVLGELAHEGVSRLIEARSMEREAHTEYRGIMFQMERMFYLSEWGRERYENNIINIINNTTETMAYLVVRELEDCNSYSLEWMSEHSYFKCSYESWLRSEAEDAFVLQKGPEHFPLMLKNIIERAQQYQPRARPNVLLVPAGWNIYYKYDPVDTTYKIPDVDAVMRVKKGPQARASIDGFSIHETRRLNVHRNKPAYNPFLHPYQIGDHHFVTDPRYKCDHFDHKSCAYTTYIHREDEVDDYAKIVVETALNACHRWETDGGYCAKLRNEHQQVADNPAATARWTDEFHDPFIYRDHRTNKWHVAEYLGDMCNKSPSSSVFNSGTVCHMAESALSPFALDPTATMSALSNLEKRMSDLVQLVRESESAPITAEYLAALANNVEGGRITQTPVDSKASGIKCNQFVSNRPSGGFQIPAYAENFGLGDARVPPMCNSWPMLQELADVGSATLGGGRWMEAQQRAAACCTTVRDIARILKSAAGTSVFLDTTAIAPWFLGSDPTTKTDSVEHAVFDLIIGPRGAVFWSPKDPEPGTDDPKAPANSQWLAKNIVGAKNWASQEDHDKFNSFIQIVDSAIVGVFNNNQSWYDNQLPLIAPRRQSQANTDEEAFLYSLRKPKHNANESLADARTRTKRVHSAGVARLLAKKLVDDGKYDETSLRFEGWKSAQTSTMIDALDAMAADPTSSTSIKTAHQLVDPLRTDPYVIDFVQNPPYDELPKDYLDDHSTEPPEYVGPVPTDSLYRTKDIPPKKQLDEQIDEYYRLPLSSYKKFIDVITTDVDKFAKFRQWKVGDPLQKNMRPLGNPAMLRAHPLFGETPNASFESQHAFTANLGVDKKSTTAMDVDDGAFAYNSAKKSLRFGESLRMPPRDEPTCEDPDLVVIPTEMSEQMLRSPMQVAWEQISQEPRLYIRVFALALLGCRLYQGQVADWLHKNILLPFELSYERPLISLQVHDAVALKGGYDTGATILGESDFMLGSDVTTKSHLGHFTIQVTAIIIDPSNIFKVVAAACQDYICGFGIKFFESYQDLPHGTDLPGADMFAFVVTYGELHQNEVPNPKTIDGYAPTQVTLQHDYEKVGKKRRWGLGCCEVYNLIWGFRAPIKSISWEREDNEGAQWDNLNKVTFLGESHSYNPATGVCDRSVMNTGHLGKTGCGSGSGRIRKGKVAYYPPEYVKPVNLAP